MLTWVQLYCLYQNQILKKVKESIIKVFPFQKINHFTVTKAKLCRPAEWPLSLESSMQLRMRSVNVNSKIEIKVPENTFVRFLALFRSCN